MDSPQYSGQSQQCTSLDGLHPSSYLQVLLSLYQDFSDFTESTNYNYVTLMFHGFWDPLANSRYYLSSHFLSNLQQHQQFSKFSFSCWLLPSLVVVVVVIIIIIIITLRSSINISSSGLLICGLYHMLAYGKLQFTEVSSYVQYSNVFSQWILTNDVYTNQNRSCKLRCILLFKTWRFPWCNGYRRRMWTRRHEFKSWTSLITFHIALIPLGKVWIQIFSLQLWVDSRAD